MGDPLKIKSETIRARVYPLMQEAIEVGVGYGWLRAHKHDDDPSPEAIKDAIEREVMNAICERFVFDDERE